MTVTIWIKTQPDINGIYRVAIEFGEDQSVFLGPADAMVYVSEILRAVACAEYDAAVLAQMTKVIPKKKNLAAETAAMVIVDLRKDRSPLKWSTPLALVPGVSNRNAKAFLTVELNGKPIGQWDADDAREHATGVVEAVHAADLDGDFYRLLRGTMDLDDRTARAAVGDLAKHR